MPKLLNTKKPIWLLLILSLIAVTPTVSADPNQPDTVRVDSVVAFVTGIGIVPVSIYNDQSLAGIEVVLKHNSPDIVIDSFSFQDGRLKDVETKISTLNSDSSIVTIAAFDSIGPGNGLLGSLYLSFNPGLQPQIVTFDTTNYRVVQIEHATTFTDTMLQTFVPQFSKGYLDIQAIPESLDSLWLNDAIGPAGSPVALNVGLYNEREITDIKIALDYGSSYLRYDSISFQGTRPLPAIINSPLVQNQISSHELLLRLTFNQASPLAPGSGLLAKLFFTISAQAPETLIVIDTNTFAGVVRTGLTLSPAAGGNTIVPSVTAGSIEIGTATDVTEILTDDLLPTGFALEQNYPNPFNPTTRIGFSLPRAGQVQIEVFNVLGRRVRELWNGSLAAGNHELTFEAVNDTGDPLASGIYFYRISAGEFVETKKMMLLR